MSIVGVERRTSCKTGSGERKRSALCFRFTVARMRARSAPGYRLMAAGCGAKVAEITLAIGDALDYLDRVIRALGETAGVGVIEQVLGVEPQQADS